MPCDYLNIGHTTIFCWMPSVACCLVVGLGLDFSVSLVSGYAHVFALYFLLSTCGHIFFEL